MENSPFKKGFTLIELMIVIVILGVLMGTILPRLTGAQARARDTGRIADLNTLSQALETYYDDHGNYPTSATPICLTGADAVSLAIKGYLKGSEIPTPPSANQKTTLPGLAAGCTGQYEYASLTNRGLADNGFIVASDVETYQKANFNISSTTPPVNYTTAITSATTVSALSAAVISDGNTLSAVDATNAAQTLYVLVN